MTRRKREVIVDINVSYNDGTSRNYLAVEDTIEQVYKQLNFITNNGNAVAINLHSTKAVEIASDKIAFSEINKTMNHDF